MLSYQHGFHAGNFADVLKHIVLTRLLAYLTQKDKPLFYLETHAGRGLYDLEDKQAQKTHEYAQGIALLWPDRKKLPPLFSSYLDAIEVFNHQGKLRYYPGSPALAINGLRLCDRLYLCELHPREYELLNQMPRGFKKVYVSHSDGITSLKALLPPLEKRGLIFIDPAYEVKEEYKTIPEAIKKSLTHFAQGVYCVWYPVVNARATDSFLRRMQALGAKDNLQIELHVQPSSAEGMTGCGLWIINPPYTLMGELKVILPLLQRYFNPGTSSYVLRQV